MRINDKIAELELQVEPLRQQAETAKKYLVLRDELRVLEISVWLENLQALRAGALKLEADLRTAQEDRQRAQEDLDAVYAAGEESLEKIRDNDVRAEALRGQVSQLDAAAQEETSAMAVLENSLSHDKQTLERLDRELADTQQRAGNLRTQADALTDRIDQIDAEAQDLTRQLEELMDALRQQALREGVQHRDARKIIAFHRAFLAQVKNTGRLYEVGMEAQYKLSTGEVFQDVSLVPSMLSKGKLGLFPEGVKDRKSLRRIFDAAASRSKGAAGRTSGNGKEKKKEDER